MTKTPMLAVTAALFSVALAAQAADNKPAAPAAAPAAAAKPAAAPAAAPAPATKPAAAPAAAAPAAAAPAAAAPAAAPAAPTEPPKPAPELDALYKAWEGNWKCDTTFAANSMGPGSPEVKVKSEVKIKKDLGGHWYKGEYKVKKAKTNPAFNGVFMLGYDAGAKAPVNLTFDDMGGYAVETGAAGASAEKIVFTGEGHMMGMKVKFRETMTKKGDKEVEHSFESDTGKGFQPMGTDVCKK
jgi:hypothetical protein